MNITIVYPGDKIFEFDILDQFVDQYGDMKVADLLFAEWNRGSDRESQYFLEQNCRSMSVGDFVKVGKQWLWCKSIGWERVDEDFVNKFQERVREYMEKSEGKDKHPFVAATAIMLGYQR
jgi:hypothetical protein